MHVCVCVCVGGGRTEVGRSRKRGQTVLEITSFSLFLVLLVNFGVGVDV